MKPVAVLALLFCSVVAVCQQPAAPKPTAPRPTAPAAQPATSEDISRLVEVMHTKKQMTEMQRTMLDQYRPMIEKMAGDMLQTITPQQRQKFQDIMSDMMSESLKAYPPDEMITDMLPIYRKYLDKADVDGMISFYSSPTGQKVLDIQPKIMRDFMATMMPKMQERMQASISRMQERIRDLVSETQSQPAQQKEFKPAAPAPPQK